MVTIKKFKILNNSFSKKTLYLNTPFLICKSRPNIFEIGNIKTDSNILDIISFGLKYIPNFKKIDLFYILYNFYISLNRLNTNSMFNLKAKKLNVFSNAISVKKDTINNYLTKEFPIKPALLGSLSFINIFRREFLSNIHLFYNTNHQTNNLNINSLRKIIISLKKENITVTSADKNIGIILIDTNLYYKLCIEHLINANTYKKIEFNPQFLIFNKAKNVLLKLNNLGHISNSLFKTIMPKLINKKLANFRILIKLHKINKFGVRPLINCSNTTLSVISKTLDFYFKPIVSKHFSFIKDSQNLIQLTNNIIYDNKFSIFSADFESLYTNIPLDKSIEIIMQMVSTYISVDISPHAIFKFLKLILLNNYFYFKQNKLNTFFLQIKGIAMGTSCGPSVANLYLSYFELKYKMFLNNSLYFRFIDDIIYTDISNSLTSKFPEIFPDLILNTTTSNKVQFLDLCISFNLDRSLNFDLYVKPTFTGSYLDTRSNHPKHIFKGIIISLVSRIRRNCTDDCNYLLHTSNLLFYLVKKGFPSELIQNIIRSYSKIDRYSLINYKDKSTDLFKNSIFFVTPFIFYFNIDYRFLNNTWLKCLPTNSNLNNFNLKILYKTTPNLNSYLISMIKIPFKEESYTICPSPLCKICKYAITNKYLFNFKSIDIYLPSTTSCCSTNIIYAIHCLKCNMSYIGQSSRSALIRISEHLYKINFYKKNPNIKTTNSYKDSEILYNHFKNADHDLKSHFKFQVIIKDVFNYRLRLESDLIYIFNSLSPSGLNTQSSDFINNFETYNFGY